MTCVNGRRWRHFWKNTKRGEKAMTKEEFFAAFGEPYLQTPGGQGVFLAGIALGMLARGQAKEVDASPVFKQLPFGRLRQRDVKRQLARLPELAKAYDVKYKELIRKTAIWAGESLLQGDAGELGVEGNFSFATAFMNASAYFWTLHGKKQEEAAESAAEQGVQA